MQGCTVNVSISKSSLQYHNMSYHNHCIMIHIVSPDSCRYKISSFRTTALAVSDQQPQGGSEGAELKQSRVVLPIHVIKKNIYIYSIYMIYFHNI